MKLTIEQLADKVNELIAEKAVAQPELIKDGRQSSTLSTRRIRDYITKGLIEKPVGVGREKWFDNSHVDALVSLRMLQHNGLSDHYIMNSTKLEGSIDKFASLYSNDETNNVSLTNSLSLNEEASTDEIMQSNALDFLKSLQGNTNSKKGLLSNEIASAGIPPNKSIFSSIDSIAYAANKTDTDLLKSLSQTKYRQFNEYLMDEKLGVFLKIDSKADTVLQKKLVEVIKNEIIKHNKENNND
jgi:DNA-binding transcriptional MerR regulator